MFRKKTVKILVKLCAIAIGISKASPLAGIKLLVQLCTSTCIIPHHTIFYTQRVITLYLYPLLYSSLSLFAGMVGYINLPYFCPHGDGTGKHISSHLNGIYERYIDCSINHRHRVDCYLVIHSR